MTFAPMVADRDDVETVDGLLEAIIMDRTEQAYVEAAVSLRFVRGCLQQGRAVEPQADGFGCRFLDSQRHLLRANLLAPPHGRLATRVVNQMETQDALGDL